MDESFTVKEFCAAEKISRSMFYKLAAKTPSQAPQTYPVGNEKRITRAAWEAWRSAREASQHAAA